MKKKHLVLCVIVIFLIGIAVYFNIQNKHTFTLANADGITKSYNHTPLSNSSLSNCSLSI